MQRNPGMASHRGAVASAGRARPVLARPAPAGPARLRLGWALLAATAGGLALVGAFPPIGFWPLAAVGPALLVVALQAQRLRAAFGLGLLFGLAFFVPLISWLVNVAWYAWIALAVAEAVIFGVLAIGQRLLLRLPGWPVAVAAWWVAAEAMRARWPYAFPWGRLAMSQAGSPAAHWAAIGGPPLLTFLVALTGATAAWAVLRGLRRPAAELPAAGSSGNGSPAAGALGTKALGTGSQGTGSQGTGPQGTGPQATGPQGTGPQGAGPTRPPGRTAPGRTAPDLRPRRAGAAPLSARWCWPRWPRWRWPARCCRWTRPGRAAAARSWPPSRATCRTPGACPDLLRASTVTQNHATATKALAAQVAAGARPAPDVVVWPENSTDLDPAEYPAIYATIASAVAAVHRPVLVGALLANPLRNAGQLWLPGRGPVASYVKRQLVPFGEYIPFRGLLSHITSLTSLQPVNFTAGDRPVVFRLGKVRLGDVICYEIGFDGLVRSEVAAGANLLALQSNDATFEVDGQSGESTQQVAMARIQAITSNRGVVYASTTGESAIIAPDGAVLTHSRLVAARRAGGAGPAAHQHQPGRPARRLAGGGAHRAGHRGAGLGFRRCGTAGPARRQRARSVTPGYRIGPGGRAAAVWADN